MKNFNMATSHHDPNPRCETKKLFLAKNHNYISNNTLPHQQILFPVKTKVVIIVLSFKKSHFKLVIFIEAAGEIFHPKLRVQCPCSYEIMQVNQDVTSLATTYMWPFLTFLIGQWWSFVHMSISSKMMYHTGNAWISLYQNSNQTFVWYSFTCFQPKIHFHAV